MSRRWWRLGRRCRVCGRRSLGVCGARAREVNRFPDGGFYAWRKWSPCSEALPGGLSPGPLLDECGDLDDVMREIAANGGHYGSAEVR